MSDVEQDNFLRNLILIIDIGVDVLKCLLENELVYLKLSLEDFVNLHLHEIYHLCYTSTTCCQCTGKRVPWHRNRVLTEQQLEILLDTNGRQLSGHKVQSASKFCCRPAYSNLTNEHFDMTMLRCILLNFGTIWKSKSTIQQAVNSLLKYRNQYVHMTAAKVPDAEYKIHKTMIEGAILDIASFCNIRHKIVQSMSMLNNRKLENRLCSEYVQTALDDMRKRLENIETKDQQSDYETIAETRIKSHEEDSMYVKTEAVEAADKILQQNNMLILVSKAGGGKTTLCLRLASIYQSRKYKPIIFVDSQIAERSGLVPFKEKCFVIIDDLFGRTNIEFDENIHKNTLDNLKASILSKSCKSKFIFAIRSHGEMFKKVLSRHEIFNNQKLVNLDHEYQLKRPELVDILSKHMEFFGLCLCLCKEEDNDCCTTVEERSGGLMQIGRRVFNQIIEYHLVDQNKNLIGFPQACRIFCSNKNMTKLGLRYFLNTSQMLVEEFKRMKVNAMSDPLIRYQYCILLHTAVKGYIDYENIDGILVMNILSNFDPDKNVSSIPNLKDMLSLLEGKYLVSGYLYRRFIESKLSLVYTFQHATMLEAVLLSYGDAFLKISCFSGSECSLKENPVQLKVIREYFRPKLYQTIERSGEQFIFVEDILLARGLLNFLKYDRNATLIGQYLRKVGLSFRNDNLIRLVFQQASLNQIETYTYKQLLNGLTDHGKCPLFQRYHLDIMQKLIFCASYDVIRAFYRPDGFQSCDDVILVKSNDALITRLFSVMVLDEESVKADRCNGYLVGEFLREIALLYRNDQFIELFFANLAEELMFHEQAEDFLNRLADDLLLTDASLPLPLERQITYVREIRHLLDGLTSCGKCTLLVKYHQRIFKKFVIFGSVSVLSAFARPHELLKKDDAYVHVEDKLLCRILFSRLYECGKYKIYNYLNHEKIEIKPHQFISVPFEKQIPIKIGQYLCSICTDEGQKFVQNFLLKIGFIFMEEINSTCCGEAMSTYSECRFISPMFMKYFVDILALSEKYRTSYRNFLEKYLFIFGSIHTVLMYCTPQNTIGDDLIKIENSILASKLISYLREFKGWRSKHDLYKCFRLNLDEEYELIIEKDYFHFHLDTDYYDLQVIRNIGEYVYEHGFRRHNKDFLHKIYKEINNSEDDQIKNLISVIDVNVSSLSSPRISPIRMGHFLDGLNMNMISDSDLVKEIESFRALRPF